MSNVVIHKGIPVTITQEVAGKGPILNIYICIALVLMRIHLLPYTCQFFSIPNAALYLLPWLTCLPAPTFVPRPSNIMPCCLCSFFYHPFSLTPDGSTSNFSLYCMNLSICGHGGSIRSAACPTCHICQGGKKYHICQGRKKYMCNCHNSSSKYKG